MAKKQTPAALARQMMIQKYKARGRGKATLSRYYGSKADKEFVTLGFLEFDNAMTLEVSSDITQYELYPEPIITQAGGEPYKTEFDAKAVIRNRGLVFQEVKPRGEEENPQDPRTLLQREAQIRAAEQAGARREVVTEKQLHANPTWLCNCRRVTAWLAAIRGIPTHEITNDVALRMRQEREVTVESLLAPIEESKRSTYLAVAFRLMQRGVLASDLDERPLSKSTRLWLVEDERS